MSYTGSVFRLCKPAMHAGLPEILTSQIIRHTQYVVVIVAVRGENGGRAANFHLC